MATARTLKDDRTLYNLQSCNILKIILKSSKFNNKKTVYLFLKNLIAAWIFRKPITYKKISSNSMIL